MCDRSNPKDGVAINDGRSSYRNDYVICLAFVSLPAPCFKKHCPSADATEGCVTLSVGQDLKPFPWLHVAMIRSPRGMASDQRCLFRMDADPRSVAYKTLGFRTHPANDDPYATR